MEYYKHIKCKRVRYTNELSKELMLKRKSLILTTLSRIPDNIICDSIFFAAINIIDAILLTSIIDDLYVSGYTIALLISKYYCDDSKISTSTITEQYSTKKIMEYELAILQAINWNMELPNPMCYWEDLQKLTPAAPEIIKSMKALATEDVYRRFHMHRLFKLVLWLTLGDKASAISKKLGLGKIKQSSVLKKANIIKPYLNINIKIA